MKLVATIALNLVCCTLAAGECTTAGSNKFQPSFDRIRIGVLRNGKAQSNVTLDIIEAGGAPHISAFTKQSSIADLPLLSPGNYWIIARAAAVGAAELCLAVEMSPNGETSSFSLELIPNQRIAGKAMQEFRGTLVDANGARIAGAKMELFKMGSLQAAPVLQAESQQDGAFRGPLPDGEYLAIFTKAWFRPVVMIFEITGKEKARDLRIGMQVQGMSATRSSATRLYLEAAYIKNGNEKLA